MVALIGLAMATALGTSLALLTKNHSKIVFLNQGGGQLFRELVASAALQIGPVSYFNSGEPLRHNGPGSIRLINAPKLNRKTPLSRLLSWTLFVIWSGARSLFYPGKPLLFIASNPPLMPIIGWLAKKLKNQKYVLLFYDIYPEAIILFSDVSENSFVVRLWRQLNRISIASADCVVTISPRLARTLSQYTNPVNGDEGIRVIPTWVDTARIIPIPKNMNTFAVSLGLQSKMTIMYSGNVGLVHDLTIVPKLANELRFHPEIHFLLIGEGAGVKAIIEEVTSLGLTNITVLPLQEESVFPLSIAAGDVGIVSIARGAEDVSMPSKAYYHMSAGNALLGISSPDSDLARVIRENRCGANVQPDDVQGACENILRWKNDPLLLKEQQRSARTAAEQKFDREICIPRMLGCVTPHLQ